MRLAWPHAGQLHGLRERRDRDAQRPLATGPQGWVSERSSPRRVLWAYPLVGLLGSVVSNLSSVISPVPLVAGAFPTDAPVAKGESGGPGRPCFHATPEWGCAGWRLVYFQLLHFLEGFALVVALPTLFLLLRILYGLVFPQLNFGF